MHIRDVIIHLLLKQPFYGYIATSVTPVESLEIPTTNMATVPSLKLAYNPIWFDSLKKEQAIGVLMHELLHVMLLHPFRKGSRERNLWTIACDMAVNEHIDTELLTKDSITVEIISKDIREEIPKFKSAEFYYDILSKNDDQICLIENDSQIKIVLKTGQELKANNSSEGEASEVNRDATKSLISELIEQAGAEGEIPAGISQIITEIYGSSEVNWRNVLKRFLSGRGKVLIRKTCKKESKRFENLPGNKRSIGTKALLALDESGSISDKLATKFYNEMVAIKKITGAEISVTRFDTECTKPVTLDMYIRKKERLKNGGTDFRPVFQLADSMRISLLIIFTDGDGPVPESSNQRVLWVLTKGGKTPAGFGHSVTFGS